MRSRGARAAAALDYSSPLAKKLQKSRPGTSGIFQFVPEMRDLAGGALDIRVIFPAGAHSPTTTNIPHSSRIIVRLLTSFRSRVLVRFPRRVGGIGQLVSREETVLVAAPVLRPRRWTIRISGPRGSIKSSQRREIFLQSGIQVVVPPFGGASPLHGQVPRYLVRGEISAIVRSLFHADVSSNISTERRFSRRAVTILVANSRGLAPRPGFGRNEQATSRSKSARISIANGIGNVHQLIEDFLLQIVVLLLVYHARTTLKRQRNFCLTKNLRVVGDRRRASFCTRTR